MTSKKKSKIKKLFETNIQNWLSRAYKAVSHRQLDLFGPSTFQVIVKFAQIPDIEFARP